MEGEQRDGKEEIEDKNGQDGGRQAIEPPAGDHGHHQHAQLVDHDDVGLAEVQIGEGQAHHRAHRQDHQGAQRVLDGEPLAEVPALPRRPVGGVGVRDDVDVQIGGQGVEPVHQVFAPLPKEALVIAPAQDDFSHAAGPGVLGDLEGGVVAVHRGDAGPQLLRQAQVGPQAAAVVVAHVLEVGGLHEQGGEAAAEGLRHAGRRADDIGVGRRAGQADQDVLAALGLGAHPGVRRPVEPVCGAPQGDLAQGGQILQGEEVVHGPGRLVGPVDLALLEPLQQIRRLDVHYLNLVGAVKDPVGQPLRHRNAGDGGHHVIEALQVLHVDGGVDADACPQQLLDILVALAVPAPGGVGVGQLIHQYELGLPRQGPVQIKLPQRDILIGDLLVGELFQPVQQSQGFRPDVRLDVPGHHVHAHLLGVVGGLQHGVGLAHARRITEEYLQLSRPGLLFQLELPQQCVRIRPLVRHGSRLPCIKFYIILYHSFCWNFAAFFTFI